MVKIEVRWYRITQSRLIFLGMQYGTPGPSYLNSYEMAFQDIMDGLSRISQKHLFSYIFLE